MSPTASAHCSPSAHSQEVTEKSERIAQLEKEKSALIKQLFEARARSAQDTSTLDSTFIWEATSTHRNRHHVPKTEADLF